MIKLVDSYGWPIVTFKGRPFKNFIRIVGMILIGKAKIKFKRNRSWIWEKWTEWHVRSPRTKSLDGLEEFVTSFKGAHFVDIRIRANGKYYYAEGDWMKSLCGCCLPHKQRDWRESQPKK